MTASTIKKALGIAGLAAFAASYLAIVAGGGEVVNSTDPGAVRPGLLTVIVPPLLAIGIALAFPARPTPGPLATVSQSRLRRETWTLLALAIAFPVTIAVIPEPLAYHPIKVVLFLVAPLVAFRVLRAAEPAIRVQRPIAWLAPSIAAVAWFITSQIWPFAVPYTPSVDPVTLAIAASLTVLTAGVLEEFFYRVWLQSRLELMIGVWPAIVVQALVFSLMHAGHILTNPDGPGMVPCAAIAAQGTTGLMLGVLWARFRNVWILIIVHIIINLPYVPMLLAGGG